MKNPVTSRLGEDKSAYSQSSGPKPGQLARRYVAQLVNGDGNVKPRDQEKTIERRPVPVRQPRLIFED